MNLTCGVRGETESEDHEIFVCHHCGMPVCERHGWVVSADDAFHDPPEARDEGRRTAGKPGPRAAMHCPGCVDKYHPRIADKHHGWVDLGRFRLVPRQRGAAPGKPAPGKPAQPAESRGGLRYAQRPAPAPAPAPQPGPQSPDGAREQAPPPQPGPQGQTQPKPNGQPPQGQGGQAATP
jgi:hypothetical protein